MVIVAMPYRWRKKISSHACPLVVLRAGPWLMSGSLNFMMSILFGFYGSLWSAGSSSIPFLFNILVKKLPKLNLGILCTLALCIELRITTPTLIGYQSKEQKLNIPNHERFWLIVFPKLDKNLLSSTKYTLPFSGKHMEKGCGSPCLCDMSIEPWNVIHIIRVWWICKAAYYIVPSILCSLLIKYSGLILIT